MPWDYLIDPVTHDLVPDGKGGYVTVQTAQTAVYNQLVAHGGACWHDAELGSQLHRLGAEAKPEQAAPQQTQLALERLVRAGRISNMEARASSAPDGRATATPGRVYVTTRFRDTTSGSLVELKLKTGG